MFSGKVLSLWRISVLFSSPGCIISSNQREKQKEKQRGGREGRRKGNQRERNFNDQISFTDKGT